MNQHKQDLILLVCNKCRLQVSHILGLTGILDLTYFAVREISGPFARGSYGT